MRFINHQHRIAAQIRIHQELPEQHSICHVLQNRVLRGTVLKPNGVAHLWTQLDTHLISDSSCHRHGCYSSRLSDPYFTPFGVPCFMQELGDLGSLSWTCFSNNDKYLIVLDSLEQLLSQRKHRQTLPRLPHLKPLQLKRTQLLLIHLLFSSLGSLEHLVPLHELQLQELYRVV